MKKFRWIVACLQLLTFSAGSQGWYFRHFQVENGLSNNAVICSVQDSQGFLWFGTKDGLNRYDGYSFKIFRNDPDDARTIGSNFIHSLYIDHHQVLWAGTEKGLYRYDSASESFSLLPTPFYEQVTDIKMDAKGDLWFISNFNLFRYNLAEKSLLQFPVPDFFEATSICTLSDESVWVSTSDGRIGRYIASGNRFEEFDLFTHSPKSSSKWIEKLYPTKQGMILAGTSNQGVKVFDPHTAVYKDILTYNENKTEIFARNFEQVSDEECWIATESGIFIYNLASGAFIHLRKEYDDPYSISDNAVYTFCRDREGGIWAGTYFGGINYYSRPALSFTKYFPEKNRNSLSGNIVREIHQDPFGNMWVGTEDAGLNKLDRSSGLFKSFLPTGRRDGISYTNIHGLLITGNELWIGTFEHGLDVMDIRTERVVRHYEKGPGDHDLKSNFIYCIYQARDSSILLGTTIGIYRYNREQDHFTPLPGFPLYNWYSSIVMDQQAVLWAATYGNGVHFFNTRTGESGTYRYDAKDRKSLCNDRVNSLFEDAQQQLWVATEGGLCRLDKSSGHFTRFTTKEGFPTNFMLSLLQDKEGMLWVSTSKGLVHFDPATGKTITYTRANGLLNDQFNFSSAYQDGEGRMYFGSVKGMISFDPGAIRDTGYVPPIFITGFQVNNQELSIRESGSPLEKSITFTDRIVLTHRQSTFSIDFASLSYTAPEMSEYAYIMEGLDQDWTFLKTNRKVYFTELAPGDYTFKVKAAGNDGNWKTREASLQIVILPPWWASRLAWFSYALAVLLLVVYIIRSYHLRTREKHRRKLEQMELAKEKELYEAKMQFFTNVAHEIKTPLTLIKGPLEKVIRKAGGMPDLRTSLHIMEKNTERLIELTNQLLDFRQTEIHRFSLNFSTENISELIREAYIGFRTVAEKKGIRFHLFPLPPELLANIDAEAFNKILANLFSNAIKYADKKADVELLPVQDGDPSFTLEVRNDGFLIPPDMREKIFEPFYRLKETEKQKGTGIGLALSRSLAELHQGILDLRPSNGRMNVFYITIPLQQPPNNTGNGSETLTRTVQLKKETDEAGNTVG